MRHLVHQGLVTGVELLEPSEVTPCDSCTYTKMTHKAISKECEGPCTSHFGGEIHSDIWGPSHTKTLGGRSYYVSFTDDKTHYTCAYLLTHKSKAFQAYLTFKAWSCTQHNAKIKTLQSDCRGEYVSGRFSAHLSQQGTVQRLTSHNTPHEKGVTERLNHTLLESVCAMLQASQLPDGL